MARHAALDLNQISQQLCPQLRHRHYHPDHPDKDYLLAAGQQELQVHEGDAETATEDSRTPREVQE